MKMSEIAKLYNLSPNAFTFLQTQEEKEAFFKDNPLPDVFYQELEMDSDYVDAHQDASFSKDSVNLHSHEFYELLYCRTGNIEYLLGTERFKVSSGDVIIVPPGVSHRPIFPERLDEPYRRYVMWFSKKMIEVVKDKWQINSSFFSKPTFLHTTSSPMEQEIKELFSSACYENIDRQIGWQTSIFGKACELICVLTRTLDNPTKIPLPEQKELIDEIVSYIEEHLQDKISLESISKHFYVSESTVSKLFKRKLDISFYHHVTARRLVAAKNLIIKNEPIDAIYSMVGFSDYSTFFKAFKKEYGISPTQFKKMYGN